MAFNPKDVFSPPTPIEIVKAEKVTIDFEFIDSITCYQCTHRIHNGESAYLIKSKGWAMHKLYQYVHIECHALMKEEVKEEIAIYESPHKCWYCKCSLADMNCVTIEGEYQGYTYSFHEKCWTAFQVAQRLNGKM